MPPKPQPKAVAARSLPKAQPAKKQPPKPQLVKKQPPKPQPPKKQPPQQQSWFTRTTNAAASGVGNLGNAVVTAVGNGVSGAGKGAGARYDTTNTSYRYIHEAQMLTIHVVSPIRAVLGEKLFASMVIPSKMRRVLVGLAASLPQILWAWRVRLLEPELSCHLHRGPRPGREPGAILWDCRMKEMIYWRTNCADMISAFGVLGWGGRINCSSMYTYKSI